MQLFGKALSVIGPGPKHHSNSRAAQELLSAARLSLPVFEDILYYMTFTQLVEFMTSSIEVVILSKVAELSRRFGLKLSESTAVLDSNEDGKEVLSFPAAPTQPAAMQRFGKMLSSLNCEDGSQSIVANDVDDLEARLDKALHVAPRGRGV